jgi:hypothetical protein
MKRMSKKKIKRSPKNLSIHPQHQKKYPFQILKKLFRFNISFFYKKIQTIMFLQIESFIFTIIKILIIFTKI